MSSINKVFVEGVLGADIVSRAAGSSNVGSVNIAVDDSYKVGNEWKKSTSWVSLEFWNKTLEFAARDLSKGSIVVVEGKLKTQSWEKDGVKHFKTVVVVVGFKKCYPYQKKEQSSKPETTYDAGGFFAGGFFDDAPPPDDSFYPGNE